jgi:hypothetical protein
LENAFRVDKRCIREADNGFSFEHPKKLFCLLRRPSRRLLLQQWGLSAGDFLLKKMEWRWRRRRPTSCFSVFHTFRATGVSQCSGLKNPLFLKYVHVYIISSRCDTTPGANSCNQHFSLNGDITQGGHPSKY